MNVTDLQGKTIGFLASGGLDSCTITHWLSQQGVRVVTFTADLGQPDEDRLDAVAERMRACGAVEAVIVPLRDEIAAVGLEAVWAQATYEGRYWNTTPLGRYATVKGVLPHVLARGIDILSHGSTGRGNDQVRFQLITNMVAPEVEVYAPWRDQSFLDAFGGREEMIAYCEQHGLPIKHSAAKPYSTDANLLGLTHEAGELESLMTPANFVTPEMGVRATEAPDEPQQVRITFEKGVPAAIDGEPVLGLAAAFEALNQVGGRNAVGINEHLLENRFVGTKSRGVYEAPGIEVLGSAYAYLLQAILDRRARRLFDQCSAYLSEQLYQGYGEDLGSHVAKSAIAEIAKLATGTVALELYKGSVHFVSIEGAPHSLYVEETASMSNVEGFDHKDSEGFVRVLGISATTAAAKGQIAGVLREA